MGRLILDVTVLVTAAVLAAGCMEASPLNVPAALCETQDAGPSQPELYPLCTVEDAHRCSPVDDEGHRGGYGWSPPGACWETCQCRYACTSQLDCPTPFSGTSSPECFAGSCVLPCDHRFRCPNGMACVEDEERGVAWCMWVSERALCRTLPTLDAEEEEE